MTDPMTLPTPEQLLKHEYELVVPDKKVGQKDTRTNLRRVYVVDSLRKRGLIDKSQWDAAKKFEKLFSIACLEGMRAAPMTERVDGGGGGNITARIASARREINRAMTFLGGAEAPAASAIWHVCGLCEGFGTWDGKGNMNLHNAAGVLTSALHTLEAFWRKQA